MMHRTDSAIDRNELTNQENLMAWLVHGEHPLNPLWEKKAYRYKFVLRSYLFYPKTLDWVKQLQGYHYLGYYLNKQTNLPCKLQRPYLSSLSRRILLMMHYVITMRFLRNNQIRLLQNFLVKSRWC